MDESQNDPSEGEISDDGLKIVIESPKRKSIKKQKSPVKIDSSEKQAIESIEKELQETLEEKATKTNLTTHNVKNILKQVVTNEHVIALVRQTEKAETVSEIPFQPKLTRAKAKELFSSKTVSSLPWPTKPPSEVQQLFCDELAEDSSGDEYVPAEEESEDDSLANSESEIRSISPPTPVKPNDFLNKVQWTDDGIFKIPPAKTKEDKDQEEEANIALRTRSKLSLSSTPLEVIEGAFIPPDITTDMYDMDCDDDVWYDFLKKFCRPLDEITKGTEDEDHDPEYNILADEEIDEVDTEELRADKAVKVTKKELNALIAELFECANAFSEEEEKTPKTDLTSDQSQASVLEDVSLTSMSSNDNSTQNNITSDDTTTTLVNHSLSSIEPASNDIGSTELIHMDQKLLLEQQMRQHVQILTQTYLLTFQHPEYHDSSIKCKESLINLKLLSEHKKDSMFDACNLRGALVLIEDWEKQFQLNTDEIKTMKQYVYRVIDECKQSYSAGIDYIPTFPALVLETISKSDVFIYPALLPRIPFKPTSVFKRNMFTKVEDELIALGMEQFTPYLAQDSYNLTCQGEVKLRSICHMIVQYMMPMKDVTKLYCHIFNCKHPQTAMNPIKYYFQTKRAPTIVHFVINLKEFEIIPPCKRNKELLPYQWKQYLYPEEDSIITSVSKGSTSFTKVAKPPAFNKSFTVKSLCKKKNAPNSGNAASKKNCNEDKHNSKLEISPVRNHRNRGFFCSTPRASLGSPTKRKLESYFKSPKLLGISQNITSCVKCMKFNSTIFDKLRNRKHSLASKFNMLPSMPFLDPCSSNKDSEVVALETSSTLINVSDTSKENDGKTIEADSTILDIDDEEIAEKDNEEDITALMIASSTIKNVGRKGPTRAEKKKEKLRKEYSATLSMLSPEDPAIIQEKVQSYAQAYFDKVRERLDSENCQKLLEILDGFSEGTNNVSCLYKQIETILGEKHQDLLDEFLTFLTPAQAKDVGKLIPYYMLSNMSLFLKKLEIYYKDQPAQLRKIYRSLTHLSACMNVTMDHVKNTILPLLKGNTLLTDWFLQIFPSEPPPQSLLTGSWEQIDVKEATVNDSTFETVTVPEVEDPYGGPNCICTCHQGEDPMYKSRSQHCTPCGIKFLQGRVYIQTGKGLRLANISFSETSNVDHNVRLNCSSADRRKRRSEISPSKQMTSPVKDHQDEIRTGNDSEDDTADCNKRKARTCRTPRKKKVKVNEKPVIIDKSETESENQTVANTAVINPNVSESTTENVENTKMEMSHDNTSKIAEENCDVDSNKLATDEVTEWDCNTSVESIGVRHSPEHSAESESEFCEESSQDNINTETDDSTEELESLSNSPVHSENSNSNISEEVSWTRDEDKVILETLQKEGDKEDTFVHIAEILSNRTVFQIKERFDTLMSLLKKMTSFIKE